MQLLTPPDPRDRIGFIVPRWTVDPLQDRQGIPFRSLTVASALYNSGYEVVFFDQEPDYDRENRLDEFFEIMGNGRVVFIWMNDLDPMIQTANTMRLAQEIKRSKPGTSIVVGGSFITLCPEELLTPTDAIDYFIRGYGEEACVELLKALTGEGTLKAVSGLVWENGVRLANPIRPNQVFRPEDLVLFKKLNLGPYEQRGGIFGNGYGTFIINTGRGCAKRCRFCYWHNHPPSLLAPEAIVDLAEFLRDNYSVRQFHLSELDFFTSRKRALSLARLWSRRLPDSVWFALVSPSDAERLSDANWDQLAEGGCRKLEFGTESGSAAMLEKLGKKHRPEAPFELTRQALRRGIEVMHNFIFGLVGETEEDRRRSLALIHKLHRLDPERVFFTFRFFQPAWATPMGEEAIAMTPGFPRILEDVPGYRSRFGDLGHHAMAWLSSKQEQRIKEMVYYYLPMATSKLDLQRGWVRWMYSILREMARLRLRTRKYAFGWDRWLYDRVIAHSLDNTYSP